MVIDFITTPIWKALGEETDRAVSAETALKRDSFADAEYVASAKTIYLSNGFGDVIDSIDCTDFIIDGMVENVSLSGNILTITFNTDSGKQNINIDLTEFINPQNYYTKTETDNLVDSAFTSAVTYVDSEILSARTDASAYTDAALVSAQTYTDNAVSGVNEHILTFEKTTSIALNELRTDIDSIDLNDAVLSAKTYTDSEILSARTDASTYTDNAVSGVTSHLDEVERITAIAIDDLNDKFSGYTKTVDFATINGSGITSGGNLVIDSSSSAVTALEQTVADLQQQVEDDEEVTSTALNHLVEEIEALKIRITALES